MSSITASSDTLMHQAGSTADEYFRAAIKNIDIQFGEGYAKKNPSLVGVMVTASAADFNNSVFTKELSEAIDGLSYSISEIASSMEDM